MNEVQNIDINSKDEEGNSSSAIKKIDRDLMIQIIIISIMNVGTMFFMIFERTGFNSYVRFVLGLSYMHVAIMVSLSAIMGLIFWFVFGILSDNTRSKYGRRRPYMLLGPIAGVSMILFAFAPNFYWCLILDGVIIGIFINAHIAAEEAVLPDVVELRYRGRANAIKGFMMTIGGFVPTLLLILSYEIFTTSHPTEGRVITHEGHIFLLTLAGTIFICTCLIGFFFIKEPLTADKLPVPKGFMESLKEMFDIDEFKENKEFFKFLLAYFLFKVGTAIATVFSFFYILKLDVEFWLLLLALATLGPFALFMGILGGKLADKKGRRYIVIPFFIIASIGYIIMPLAGTGDNLNLELLVLGLILMLIGTATLGAPLSAWKEDLLPKEKRGQYLGIMNITGTLNQLPAVFLAALIADTYGVEWTFLLIPIFLLASLPIFLMVKETLQVEKIQSDSIKKEIDNTETEIKHKNEI